MLVRKNQTLIGVGKVSPLGKPREQDVCLRLSGFTPFPLRIEVGRWRREPVEERICLKCVSGQLENETHFMFECAAYERPRESYTLELGISLIT